MKVGLLWYDDSGEELAEKVARAARHHARKYGVAADVCFVHPSSLGGNGKVKQVGGVWVAGLPTVLRNHFWIGREERKRKVKRDA